VIISTAGTVTCMSAFLHDSLAKIFEVLKNILIRTLKDSNVRFLTSVFFHQMNMNTGTDKDTDTGTDKDMDTDTVQGHGHRA
jgi:hypothetical protein